MPDPTRRLLNTLQAGAARIPTEMEATITYPVVELDDPVPDNLFTFTPPPDAKLLEKRITSHEKSTAYGFRFGCNAGSGEFDRLTEKAL